MRFANYSRKSVYSDSSDSIDNQYRMSKEYAELHFNNNITCFEKYYDEDYSGSNVNRPGLQQLLSDIKNNLFDVLIVYQLDRLSRNVRDFSTIYELLEQHNVKFISVKEKIDTTTPIGRAMMYITVVFAQMERENISMRVSDNLAGLAKKGLWAGGSPPVGYISKRTDINGKNHVVIVPDTECKKFVTYVFDTFLEGNFTLSGLETYFKHNNVKTKRGAFFSSGQIHKMLTMPYCCEATQEVYDYYESKGCNMATPREYWNGKNGVMVYGRSTERTKKHTLTSPEEWIVCVGQHKPFITAEKWLQVQSRFNRNKIDRTMKYDVPLLKTALKCKCGCIMGVSRKKYGNKVTSYYYCSKRNRQGVQGCDMSQIRIDLLDNKVIEIFKEIELDPLLINQYLKKTDDIQAVNPQKISNQIHSCERKIEHLTETLMLAQDSSASKYIIKQIERLDLELQALNREYNMSIINQKKQKAIQQSSSLKISNITKLIRNFDTFDSIERNSIVKEILLECIWDGKTLNITL